MHCRTAVRQWQACRPRLPPSCWLLSLALMGGSLGLTTRADAGRFPAGDESGSSRLSLPPVSEGCRLSTLGNLHTRALVAVRGGVCGTGELSAQPMRLMSLPRHMCRRPAQQHNRSGTCLRSLTAFPKRIHASTFTPQRCSLGRPDSQRFVFSDTLRRCILIL